MEFRTEYHPRRCQITLNPTLPIVLAGSCFSHNIGGVMRRHLWNAVNVTGTLFNPLSVGRAVEIMVLSGNQKEEMFRQSLFFNDDTYRSWLFDSSFSSPDLLRCVESFIERSDVFSSALEKGKSLILTFGTSICYFIDGEMMPVGNCHKQPSSLFARRRLSIKEIVDYWSDILSRLREKYDGLNVIFTVSPVRHIKDGFEGNLRSKAILILAIEELCSTHDFCHYFPAYEILTDDLRDYRFYASDLVHPSETAIDYVWNKFKETYLNQQGEEFLEEGSKIVKGLLHQLKPDAMGQISNSRLDKERQRMYRLFETYEDLHMRHPDILRFDYPFTSDPGF